MRMRLGLIVLCLSVLMSVSVRAAENSEIEELKSIIEKQNQMIESLMDRVEALEEGGGMAMVEKEAAPVPAAPTWADNLKLKGDFRYRHESLNQEGRVKRTRHRMRLRMGAEAKISPEIKVGTQFMSGSDDPASGNQSFDGGFTTKSLMLDLAYLQWNHGNTELIAGKMKNPFVKPGGTELVWDGDLTPEGIFLQYDFGTENNAFINLGGFWIEERSSDADSGVIGTQVGVKRSFAGGPVLMVGFSYYDYINAEGKPTFYDTANSYSNSVDAAGKYVEDYNELEFFIDYSFTLGDVPASVFLDYVENLAASNSNRGILAGVKYGKCKDPGSTELMLNYRKINSDAVVGVFTDSDFAGGGTDAKGFELGFGYQVRKNMKAGLSYFLNDKGLSTGTDYKKLQLDMGVKF